MCGIVGILSEGLSEKTVAELRQMMASMAHRGPDGDGVWMDAQGVTLAERAWQVISANLPFGSGFVAGFALGFKLG